MKTTAHRIAALAACLALGAGGAPAVAQPMEIVFGISAKTGSLQQVTAAEFTRRANEKLGDRAKVVLYDSAQLGKDKELMQKLKIGSVHIALPSSIMSSIADEFGVFDMPFIIRDREHLGRVEERVFWPKIAPTAEAKGYKVLGLWENGVRHITNNSLPVNTPADLSGIKLRTPKSKWRVKMFERWGANPTPMAFSEVFVALETGVIDGQENPLTNIHAAKFQEVQKYLSITGHVYSPSYPTAGAEAWGRLPADVRRTLEETARDVQRFARQKGAEGDADLLSKLKSAGMQVNTADKSSFVEASKPVYEQFAEEVPVGKALIDEVLSL